MNKKRVLVTTVIVLVLVALAYLQFRTIRSFNWSEFKKQTSQASEFRIALAVVFIYATYLLRAIRWKILLRPVKEVSWSQLISPMFIGFTGLAILGRPGELIRPYLIARRQRLPISSQMAVWTVERVFDMGSFAFLLMLDLIFAPSLRKLEKFERLQIAGFLLSSAIFALGLVTFFVWRNGPEIASWSERLLLPFSTKWAKHLSEWIRSFGAALHTIHDLVSLSQVAGLSIVLWLLIAFAYIEGTHAYPMLRHMTLSYILLLMAFSIAGSLVQLPVVGGGSQLATVGAMVGVFRVEPELAVSCGLLLWLITFVAVTPVGLSLARREHVSLVKLSEEAEPA